jgi:hypothetical protein
MRHLLAALVAVVILAGVAHSADDVAGWQATKWGMPEGEVQRVLGLTSEPNPPKPQFKNYAAWRIPLTISGQDYEAALLFGRDTRRLEAVQIEGKKDNTFVRYNRLRDLLIDKYGQPVKVPNAIRGNAESLEWRFKSTVIKLEMLHVPGTIDSTFLNYVSTELGRSDRDKL